MGEWYEYNLKFANNPNRRLADELVELGVAYREENVRQGGIIEEYYKIRISKLELEEENNVRTITIREYEDGSLGYVNKWVPDDRLVKAIASKIATDIDSIIETERRFTGGSNYARWYENDKGVCTKDGCPVIASLHRLNEKIIKETPNGFQVSIPIGEENAKWGTFTVPKENVTYNSYSDNGVTGKWGISVFLSEETIPVSFKGHTVQMNANDIADKYYESKNKYSEDIRSSVYLELPANRVTKKKDRYDNEFYIVNIPCSKKYSSNEELTFAAFIGCVRNAGNGNYIVDIGQKGKGHRAYVYEDGKKTTMDLKNYEIEKIFKDAIAYELDENVRNQTDIDNYDFFPYVDEYMREKYPVYEESERDDR